jgi:P27 family predicted phage terminase small subunit
MPARAKAPEDRTGHSGKTFAIEVTGADVPVAPDDLSDFAQALWHELWTDEVGQFYQPTEAGIVKRYCLLTEQYYELAKIVEDEGMVASGSQGQDVQHPAMKMMSDIAGKLQSLEDRLLRTPESRIRMGLKVAEKKSALDELRDK